MTEWNLIDDVTESSISWMAKFLVMSPILKFDDIFIKIKTKWIDKLVYLYFIRILCQTINKFQSNATLYHLLNTTYRI